MKSFAEQLAELAKAGYRVAEAQAKVAHDAILLAMYKSGFKKNCTVKGGVVMCELTKTVRRTTMDIDVDFIHCSISDTSVRRVVARWSRLTGLKMSIFGTILELRQDDYRGKRVYLDISDGSTKKPVRTKIDIGVHTHDDLRQVERRFSALADERKATLYSNSCEQIFAEKLLSLIRHGLMSTRTKDVFDLHYLSEVVSRRRLKRFVDAMILRNKKCPLREPARIIDSIAKTFSSRRFLRDMASPRSNWLGLPPKEVADSLLAYLRKIMLSGSIPKKRMKTSRSHHSR